MRCVSCLPVLTVLRAFVVPAFIDLTREAAL